jgi:hypothetical protein
MLILVDKDGTWKIVPVWLNVCEDDDGAERISDAGRRLKPPYPEVVVPPHVATGSNRSPSRI